MASFKQYTASGGSTEAFSIPNFTSDEIKVRVNGVLKTAGTHYNITSHTVNGGTVTWTSGNVPSSGTVYIYRDTNILNNANSDVEGKATYSNGSPIYHGDLNNNQKQALRALEESDRLIQSWQLSDGVVETDKIKDGTIVDADINASANISGSKLADDSVTLAKLGSGALPTDITVASANIVNSTIVDADISNTAEIAVSKLADGTARQILQTASNGNDVEWTSNVDVPGTLDVTGAADFDSTVNVDGTATLATVDINSGNIDGTVIGATTKAAGSFTTINATGVITGDGSGLTDITADTATDLAANTKITNSEQASHTANDTTYYTTSASDARYYNIGTTEEIVSGETWVSDDAKVATTSAIDARITDLVDDVGGFVPIANETSFPNANPDVNNGTGTLVSIKALASNLVSNGSGVATIANGTVGNSTVTITGLANSTTYAATFGMIVETTATLNTYTFHRLTPKATEVTTVAGSISSVNTVATNISDVNNFADLYQISTSAPTQDGGGNSLATGDLWFDSSSNKALMIYDGSSGDGFSAATPTASVLQDIAIVSGQITFVEDLGSIADALTTGTGNNINTVASNIANVNTVAGNNSNINTVAGNNSNITSVAGAITNINTTVSNLASINNFAEVYRIASSAPTSSLNEGDLWYDSTNNVLKYYTGSAWTVTAGAGLSALADDSSPELASHLDCNNKNLTEVGTVSGDNLQIDFGTLS